MAHDEDEEGPPSPERDWDRNISSALEGLRPPDENNSTPAREEILESVSATAEEAESGASSRARPLLMGAFAMLGAVLIGLALWLRPGADGSTPADSTGRSGAAVDAVSLERLDRLDEALREAAIRERQLLQEFAVLGRRVVALESDAATRLAALEQQLLALTDGADATALEAEPSATASVAEAPAAASAAEPEPEAPRRSDVAAEPREAAEAAVAPAVAEPSEAAEAAVAPAVAAPSEAAEAAVAPVAATEVPATASDADTATTAGAATEAGEQDGGGRAVAAVASSARRWTVSLVTLSKRSTAENYARGVRERDWPASVREVGTNGGLWRVSSGAFGSRAEAEAHGEEIRRALRLESVWVTRAPGG